MGVIYFLAIILFILLSLLLCSLVLVQEGKGSTGIAGMGGADASDSMFGTSTPEVLRRFTGWLAFAFLASCVVLSLWTSAFERTRAQRLDAQGIEEVQGHE